jgi:hypothetical protein
LADEHGFLDLGEDLDEVPGLLGVEFLAAAHDTTAFVAEDDLGDLQALENRPQRGDIAEGQTTRRSGSPGPACDCRAAISSLDPT